MLYQTINSCILFYICSCRCRVRRIMVVRYLFIIPQSIFLSATIFILPSLSFFLNLGHQLLKSVLQIIFHRYHQNPYAMNYKAYHQVKQTFVNFLRTICRQQVMAQKRLLRYVRQETQDILRDKRQINDGWVCIKVY